MKNLLLKIYSILAWTTMLITSAIITPFFLLVWLLTFWWDKRRLVSHMMATFWAWHYQSLIPFWKLRLEGRKKIPWDRPVVLVANHRSLVDILALHKVRRPFKWVSKAENFKLPFIGMVLSLNNCVKINRESHSLRTSVYLPGGERDEKRVVCYDVSRRDPFKIRGDEGLQGGSQFSCLQKECTAELFLWSTQVPKRPSKKKKADGS